MIELIQIFLQHKKYILSFTFTAVLLSIIVTFPAIMPPKYESQMIIYVANPLSTDRANLFSQKEGGIVSQFGEREDADRLITIMQSSGIKNIVIDKFDLIKHYKIEKGNAELKHYYAKRKLDNNVKIKRNDNDAIEITCWDTDAELAQQIVKTIVSESNSANKNIIKDNKQKVVTELDKLIESKNKELQNMSETGKEAAIATLIELQNVKNQYTVSLNNDFTSIYIIEDAAIAIKKSKPVRWQIVLMTAFSAFGVSLLIAVAFHTFSQYAQPADI
jgi:uncharacterized protein involved in exopolysaccharide biosynthesis